VIQVLALLAAVLLNATGMAAAGLALWRATRANRAVQQAIDVTLFGEAGGLLLNLFMLMLGVWRLAAST
jgi:hypothetical protein